jgi:Rad51
MAASTMTNPYLRRRSRPSSPLELQQDRSSKEKIVSYDRRRGSIVAPQPSSFSPSSSSSVPKGHTAWQLYADRSNHERGPSNQFIYLLAPPPSSNVPPPLWMRLDSGIFELSGTGGAGKTQMALTLLQQTALHQQKSLYISLRGSTAVRKAQQRLQQMNLSQSNQKDAMDSLLPLIQMLRCRNLDEFLEWLRDASAAVDMKNEASSHNCRIIVIDSIADLFRIGETNETSSYLERSQHFYQIIQQLQRWVHAREQQSQEPPLSILLINQVTTTLAGDDIPALGLSWSHCMHTRFFIEREERDGISGRRRLTVSHSPRHAVQSAAFRITPTNGCVYLPEER